MAKEIVLFGEPHPKQIAFFEAEARHVAYGGARGGGKSWAMRRKFVLMALRHDRLKLLLLRRTFAELEGNHITPLLEELSGVAKYNTEKRIFRFPNGSTIKLGYCDADKDVFQYQGQEYEVIGFEEATQFTEYQMKFIATSNRTTRTDVKPRIYYTCNPGGPGHNYIKRLFIDRVYEKDEHPEDYVFIQAFARDNKTLIENDPGYIRHLENLPSHLRKAMPIEHYINIKTARQTRYTRMQKNELWLQMLNTLSGTVDPAIMMEGLDYDGKEELLENIRRAQQSGMLALQNQVAQLSQLCTAQQTELNEYRSAMGQAQAAMAQQRRQLSDTMPLPEIGANALQLAGAMQ